MIKLIASDVDGTLLPVGAQHIDDAVFTQIRRLTAAGIPFCAASGRQYSSLRRLFAPVAEEILYLCENGAIVYQNGDAILKTPLPAADAVQLIGQILAQPDCEVLISGADTSYLIPKSRQFVQHMENVVGNRVVTVTSAAEIPEEIIKVTACTARPAEEYRALFASVWERHLHVAVAGVHWLDFTLAHKGAALVQLADRLGISTRDMMVFGDNANDISMLRCAEESYAMEGAAPAVRAAARHVCSSVTAVLQEISCS